MTVAGATFLVAEGDLNDSPVTYPSPGPLTLKFSFMLFEHSGPCRPRRQHVRDSQKDEKFSIFYALDVDALSLLKERELRKLAT